VRDEPAPRPRARAFIGFTWEHVLHVYYKRALWIQAQHGYASKHRARIAAHLLD
jgi:hypothetical protein